MAEEKSSQTKIITSFSSSSTESTSSEVIPIGSSQARVENSSGTTTMSNSHSSSENSFSENTEYGLSVEVDSLTKGKAGLTYKHKLEKKNLPSSVVNSNLSSGEPTQMQDNNNGFFSQNTRRKIKDVTVAATAVATVGGAVGATIYASKENARRARQASVDNALKIRLEAERQLKEETGREIAELKKLPDYDYADKLKKKMEEVRKEIEEESAQHSWCSVM